MASIETNTRKIIARLKREGWIEAGGSKHAKFEHPEKPGGAVIVPRHSVKNTGQNTGTARSIARAAGWI